MEALIDLNAKPDFTEPDVPKPSKVSLLRRRSVTYEELQDATSLGVIAGLGVAVALDFLFWVGFAGPLGRGDLSHGAFWFVALLIIAAGPSVGVMITRSLLETEAREGFLRVDETTLEYWTRQGEVAIPTGDIFGAAPEGIGRKERLRICYLAALPCGFGCATPDFKHYEPVAGPAIALDPVEGNGNYLARETILLHLGRRRKAGLPVADMPPYRFTSAKSHRAHIFFGETVLDAFFKCDGRTIICMTGAETHRIPVTAVRDVAVDLVQSKYGPTKYNITLILDPSCGRDTIKLDLLGMSNPAEVDKYCRCLPTLLPADEECTCEAQSRELTR